MPCGSNPKKFLLHKICDMIKGNELQVGNIDFGLSGEGGDKFACFTLTGNKLICDGAN